MNEDSTTVVNDVNGSKFAQLNLLLDKAKMYSQFIGQQISFKDPSEASTDTPVAQNVEV